MFWQFCRNNPESAPWKGRNEKAGLTVEMSWLESWLSNPERALKQRVAAPRMLATDVRYNQAPKYGHLNDEIQRT